MKHRLFATLSLLVLLVVVAAPVFAAPLRQDPPPFDPETGEEIQTFVEFGPPNGDPGDQFVALPGSGDLRAAHLVPYGPAGDLPSYDDEALAKLDPADSIEFIRHLSVGIGPRLSGTPQEGEAAAYLGNILQSYGYEVTYPTFSQTSTRNVAAVTSPNATLPGGPNWQMHSSTSAMVTGDAAAVAGEVIYAGNGQSASNFPPDPDHRARS